MKTAEIFDNQKIFMEFKNKLFNNSGFSLIEMMVATAIASIMLLTIYAAHNSITKAIFQLTGVADFYENINLVITRIDKDLSCAYFNRNNNKLFFIGESNYDEPYNAKLNFITVDHRSFSILSSLKKPYPRSDVQEIGYSLETDPEIPEIYYLVRREQIDYDEEPESGGVKDIILENVVDLKFEFGKGRSWVKAWDSREGNKFPEAVKTTLKVRNYDKNDEEFIFISRLNLIK